MLRAPRFTMLAAATAAALLATAAPPSAADAVEPCADAVEVQRAVARLNALRAQRGAPCVATRAGDPPAEPAPLAWEARLAESAREQATVIALREELSHLDGEQRGFGARLQRVGYRAANAGENLAAGQDSLDETLAAWLASPKHCANLMQPLYSDVGLACVQRRHSRHERYWVAILGTPARR